MTSLFSSSWMCRLCGREACAECFEQVKDLTDGNPGANEAEVIALQIKREKHSHSNPFFLACTRRNEHQSKDFSPMSRFCKAELGEAINEMEALIRTPDIDALPGIGAIDPALQGPSTQTSQINGTSAFARFLNGHVPEPAISTITSSSVPSNNAQIDPALLPSIAVADIPSHTPKYFTDEELTEEVFRPLWQKGEPLVVTGLLPKFKIKWTPEYFIEKYESQACLILECQTDVNKRITVGEFFSWFGKYNGRTECWKLKVRPPNPRVFPTTD
jgi:lysine-specific demethylase 3